MRAESKGMGTFGGGGTGIDLNECDVVLEQVAIIIVSDVANSFLIVKISDHFKGCPVLQCGFGNCL